MHSHALSSPPCPTAQARKDALSGSSIGELSSRDQHRRMAKRTTDFAISLASRTQTPTTGAPPPLNRWSDSSIRTSWPAASTVRNPKSSNEVADATVEIEMGVKVMEGLGIKLRTVKMGRSVIGDCARHARSTPTNEIQRISLNNSHGGTETRRQPCPVGEHVAFECLDNPVPFVDPERSNVRRFVPE